MKGLAAMKGDIRADIPRSNDTHLSNRPTKHRKRHENSPFPSFPLLNGERERAIHVTLSLAVFSRVATLYPGLVSRFRGESDKPGINNAGANHEFAICVNYHKRFFNVKQKFKNTTIFL
jgi:hypothetical protein